MAKIKTLKQGGEILYPRTSTKAVLDDSGSTVESRLTALESSSGAVEVDTTLSVPGKAADAKATGDKVQEVAQTVTTLNTSVTSLGTTVTGLNTSVTNMDTRVTALENAGGGGGGVTIERGTLSGGGGGEKTVTFTKTFAQPPAVFWTHGIWNAPNSYKMAANTYEIYDITTTGFKYVATNDNAQSYPDTWTAIG